jgi:hypothetical protein
MTTWRRKPRVISDEAFDVLSDADRARSAHAVRIAARWLRVGTQLWLDGIVHIGDVIDEHGEVNAELVRQSCIRVIKRHPGAARMRAVGVTVAGIGVVAEWVAQGATEAERANRKALVMDSFTYELDKISRAEFNKRVQRQLTTEDSDND